MSQKSPVPFTDDDLNDLLALLDAGPYDRLELETDRFKLRLRRDGDGNWTKENETLDQPEPLDEQATASAGAAPSTDAPQEDVVEGLTNVPAPMGGVFYHAPKPGADSFVRPGDPVEHGTIIGIIEVMKLMNSVRANASGEVVEILAANAEYVAQGQTLLRVKPSE